jgi:hypothetical protein
MYSPNHQDKGRGTPNLILNVTDGSFFEGKAVEAQM